MSNSVNLALDVTKTGIQNPLIKVRQGDGGFETLQTTVTSNGEPLDLQGWTITFMGTTAGNHKIVDGNVNIVEAPNGIFDYTPSKAWGMDIGEFKIAYFKFVKGDGSASSANFRVNVIEAVDLTQEEAKNYISVVDTTIAEINQHLTNSLANVTQSIAEANNNANTVASNVNTLGKRVDDYNNKLAAVKVGGRNYLLNSSGDNLTGWGNTASVWSITTDQTRGGVFTATPTTAWTGGGTNSLYQIVNKKSVGQQVTVSFWAKVSVGGAKFHSEPQGGANAFNTNLTTDWARYSYAVSNFTGTIYFMAVDAGATYYLDDIKLEIGNIPTDWTPAPEDVPSNDAQLVHKTGTETIAGDKTFTSPINGQLSGNAATSTKWQTARTLALTGDVTGSVTMDGSNNVSIATTGTNLVHKNGNETIAGDKTFTGVATLTSVKSSNIKTGSVTLNGLTIDFRQTVVGVNVYMHGTFAGTFGTDQSYVTSSSVVPTNIDNPKQTVVLTIVSNGGVSGITNNSPWELEVLITATGAIQYRAKNLRDNDITARNTSIVGADSAFYTIE